MGVGHYYNYYTVLYFIVIAKVIILSLKPYFAYTVSLATKQLSPEMGSSVPQIQKLSLDGEGELVELERGKQKNTTSYLDDPQHKIEGNS